MRRRGPGTRPCPARQARGETVCSITSKQVIRLNFPVRPDRAGERIVVGDVGEPVAGHVLRERARAGAVVQHVDVAPGAEALGQHGGDVGRPDIGVFGVDPRVVGVVDVGGELGRGPVVEEAGEQEAAVLAAAVVHLDAGEAERERVGGRAVFVEVDAVERRGEPAAQLARLPLVQDSARVDPQRAGDHVEVRARGRHKISNYREIDQSSKASGRGGRAAVAAAILTASGTRCHRRVEKC